MKSTKKIICLLNLVIGYSFLLAQSPTDCINAIVACGNSQINLDVSGVGQQELTSSNSCQGQENNSVWLKVTTITAGSLGFTLRPESADLNEDYDFYVFGPNVTCGALGTAIRCSSTNPVQAGLSNNFTGMNSSSQDTSEGPGADGDSFVRSIDAQAGETYFIVIDRPIGQSAFSLEWTGTAEFSNPPENEASTSGTPIDLDRCDTVAPFNDGFTTFNLQDNTNSIRGSQINTVITYHETESDANIGINSITGPYTNTFNPQTIYTRITNTVTECFDLAEFTLTVNSGPNFTTPQNYTICDDLNDGDNTNGRAEFILSSRNDEILGGQDPSSINITYHSTLSGAELGTTATQLPDAYNNNTAFREDIFVRIEDTINTNCFSTSTLTLIVNPIPNSSNSTILQCDEDGLQDGITVFNLNEAEAALTNGANNVSTMFYVDAARTNTINNTNNYLNTSNPETIYVEVINNDTSCIAEVELVLSVSVTDTADTFISECDDDGLEDGFHTFNLSDANSNIINGSPLNLSISYYDTYDNALSEENPLNNTFTNTTPRLQTIYARAENNNNCYGISRVFLVAELPPQIEKEVSVQYCTNFFPDTITIDAGEVNGNQSAFTYNWSTGETTYSIDINTVGTYNVRITNVRSQCFIDRTITVNPSSRATFNTINVDNASQNNTITINVSGEGIYQYSISNRDDGILTPFQDSNIFQNVKPGIYDVFVRDVENDCGTVNDNISVIGFPKFFTPNNDGFNDTWQVYGISEDFQSKTKVFIYNRYGKLLKELSPREKGWDGIYNGRILPSDDYWFNVLLEDGRLFNNHFTLKR